MEGLNIEESKEPKLGFVDPEVKEGEKKEEKPFERKPMKKGTSFVTI